MNSKPIEVIKVSKAGRFIVPLGRVAMLFVLPIAAIIVAPSTDHFNLFVLTLAVMPLALWVFVHPAKEPPEKLELPIPFDGSET